MELHPGSLVLAPSLLAADFRDLSQAAELCRKYHIKALHLDIMDGHFVPNISFGPPVIQALRDWGLFLDCHLMVQEPARWIDPLVDLGVHQITIHAEADVHLHRTLSLIKQHNLLAGVALNPHSPIGMIENCLDLLDTVLVMTVNPGFGGQKFIGTMVPKLEALSTLLLKKKCEDLWIAVDGGIDGETLRLCYDAGARYFVAGSSFFSASRRTPLMATIEQLSALG